MKKIYLDNAATSFPKPPAVARAVQDYLVKIGGNAGRSAHWHAAAASRLVFETRELISRLIRAPDSSRIIFTLNATEALNQAILGLPWRSGDRVLTTSLEHNSVMRPLRHLEAEKHLRVEIVAGRSDGRLDPHAVAARLHGRTRLVVMTHASNVIGTIMPVRETGRICRRQGIPFLVDAAQTAGKLPIDVERDNIDLLAFSGHKGLFGPPGTGVLYVRPGIELQPLKFGGTGSQSQSDRQPDFMPDMFESGTLNLAGIAGLRAGVSYILEQGIDRIHKRIEALTRRLLSNLSKIKGVSVYGQRTGGSSTGVVAFNIAGHSSSDIGRLLNEYYDIAIRVGLHCSPQCHRTIGTYPGGCVRASIGYFNTVAEIDALGKALCRIAG